MQKNPFLVVATGDFNAKSSNWFSQDKTRGFLKTKQDLKVIQSRNLTSQYGIHQDIKEPSHILDTSSSCIDLFFTRQPNWIIESTVHSSLHSNCYLQLVNANFNLGVAL